MESVDVLIVGGGFAGLNAALAAARVSEGRHKIALLSREPNMTVRPRLYEANPETLAVDLRPSLTAAGVDFLQGEIVDIDVARSTVRLASGESIGFKRLILATGSVGRVPAIPGAERGYRIDDMKGAIAFDKRLATITHDNPTVVVVGSGLSGIELVTELRDRISQHAGSAAGERARIVLIERGAVVAPELGESVRPVIQSALEAANVELRLQSEIVELADNAAVLSTGETIAADAVVFCIGFSASPLTEKIPGDKDQLGRIKVDAYLRAPQAKNVFVAGDTAHAWADQKHVALQSCQHAITLGKFAGENAMNDLLGRKLCKYSQIFYLTCLDLGRSGGLIAFDWERRTVATGARAKSVKQTINRWIIYPPEANPKAVRRASSLPGWLSRRSRHPGAWMFRFFYGIGAFDRVARRLLQSDSARAA